MGRNEKLKMKNRGMRKGEKVYGLTGWVEKVLRLIMVIKEKTENEYSREKVDLYANAVFA
jgi:hypothetical protein